MPDTCTFHHADEFARILILPSHRLSELLRATAMVLSFVPSFSPARWHQERPVAVGLLSQGNVHYDTEDD